jgi:flagellar protein FlgJ
MTADISALNYQSLEKLNALAKRDPKLALKKVTSEFESLIWYEILKGFDRTIMKSNLLPESFERKLYQDFLYQEVARAVSGRPRGFGDFLYRQLLKSPYFKKAIENPNK